VVRHPGFQTLYLKGKPSMGDKSPKSNQKQAAQKQAKNNSADMKKKADIASKQVAGKKK